MRRVVRMATRVFTGVADIQLALEIMGNKAVENACNRLLGKLQEFIYTEYYDQFTPEQYRRTEQFYRSAMTEMLTHLLGQVFMNPDMMNYPWNETGWSWSGQQQIEAANIGSHGGWTTETSVQHRYWDKFVEYCNNNAITILKEELAKQGIKSK